MNISGAVVIIIIILIAIYLGSYRKRVETHSDHHEVEIMHNKVKSNDAGDDDGIDNHIVGLIDLKRDQMEANATETTKVKHNTNGW